MAWERLKTDYKDAVWSGLRKFIPIDNGDGSYSVKDVTQYTVYDESFFGAYDANRINTAVNAIMAALENGTDLYGYSQSFLRTRKLSLTREQIWISTHSISFSTICRQRQMRMLCS